MGNSKSKLAKTDLERLQKTTNFTARELTLWFRGFSTDCPKNLDKSQFIALYKSYFPFGDVNKYANLVFKHIDTKEDNVIDFDEFIAALSIARDSTRAKIEWAFKLYDLDEDGMISKSEMLFVVDAIYRMVGESVGTREDESNSIARVDRIFELMDEDRDGNLSFEEFQKGASKDSLIMNSLNLYAQLV